MRKSTRISDGPTSVYRYYDEHEVLIYVGITSRGATRNLEHNQGKAWWQHVVRQDVEHYSTRREALSREKALILEYRPPFNRQHNPSHAEARAAYEAFARSKSGEGGNALELYRGMDRRLPLTFHSMYDGGYVLRTYPQHFALAATLMSLSDGQSIKVLNEYGGKIGQVKKVWHLGMFSLIDVAGPTTAIPAISAHARIAIKSLKTPMAIAIRGIDLVPLFDKRNPKIWSDQRLGRTPAERPAEVRA